MNVVVSAKNVDILATNVDFSAKEPTMTDVDMAASLLDEIIGQRGVRETIKSMLERAYSELSKRNGAWTRRRVRAVFNKEASRIENREIEEMKAILDGRREQAAYRAETARIAALAVVRAKAQDCGEL
ncbi:hypothetical protein [Paenochrobactrum glaciei]|uniref:hypothetical protein n=1 Tax=Paenochrobactrum glaciei TaxID=486407 RepID=UPI0035BC29E5